MIKRYINIDGYEQIIEYKTPEAERKSRINVSELLGDGGQIFHKSGEANTYKTKFTTLIPQNDNEQLNYFDNAITEGNSLLIISNFNHIPSGYYYFTGSWKPKFLDELYFKCEWELTLIGVDDRTTDNYSESVSDILNKDTTSFQNSSSELKEGNSNSEQNKQLQILLQYNGFYLTGSLDGVWGKETTKALQQYQQANLLKVTGTLNAETKASLRF